MTSQLTHYASRLARYLVKQSERGLHDRYNWAELKSAFTEDEQANLVEAAYELKQHGFINISEALNAEDGIYRLIARFELYWALDREVFDYDTDADVAELIQRILEDESRSSAAKLAKCQSWTLRRFNPAFAKIVSMFPEGRIYAAQAGEPYAATGLLVTPEERVLLKTTLQQFELSQQSVATSAIEDAATSDNEDEDDSSDGKVKLNLGVIAVERPASKGTITLLLIVLVVAAGLWGWPKLADRFAIGFARNSPILMQPDDGVTLSTYPRNVILEWQPMAGATRYIVNVEAQDPATGEWFPHPGKSRWTTANNFQEIEFIGDQPGRWRVVAIDANNVRSRVSAWSEFFYETISSGENEEVYGDTAMDSDYGGADHQPTTWGSTLGVQEDSDLRVSIHSVSRRGGNVNVSLSVTNVSDTKQELSQFQEYAALTSASGERISKRMNRRSFQLTPGASKNLALSFAFERPISDDMGLSIAFEKPRSSFYFDLTQAGTVEFQTVAEQQDSLLKVSIHAVSTRGTNVDISLSLTNVSAEEQPVWQFREYAALTSMSGERVSKQTNRLSTVLGPGATRRMALNFEFESPPGDQVDLLVVFEKPSTSFSFSGLHADR